MACTTGDAPLSICVRAVTGWSAASILQSCEAFFTQKNTSPKALRHPIDTRGRLKTFDMVAKRANQLGLRCRQAST